MLASRGEPREGTRGWLFEPKWDGYRAMVYVENGSVTAGNAAAIRFEWSEAFVTCGRK